jgi:RND family efflux transporter MFP subunit
VATQQEYLLALRTADMMGGDGDRVAESARRRLELFGVTPDQIERLAQGGEPSRTVTIYNPASGTVTELSVVEGMQAQAGRTLMQIADLSSLWLQVDVPESDLGWVDTQTRAVVEVDSRPGDDLRGRVEYVYDTLDPMTRTGTARIVVPNPNGRLKPGMFATATLNGRPSDPALVVPAEAVIRTGTDAVVIRALGEGRFEPQPVTLGQEADGMIQILSGLAEGDEIVTSAQFLIDSEARLAASIGAMSSAPAPAASPVTTDR